MLARIWLERRDQIRFEQGIEQGIGRGREQGIKKGIEQTQKKWEAWNNRRLLAIEEGREFDEPPPRLDEIRRG